LIELEVMQNTKFLLPDFLGQTMICPSCGGTAITTYLDACCIVYHNSQSIATVNADRYSASKSVTHYCGSCWHCWETTHNDLNPTHSPRPAAVRSDARPNHLPALRHGLMDRRAQREATMKSHPKLRTL
jgi:hypothetical protein